MTWTSSAFRWLPGSPLIRTGTTCSGTPGSVMCRATPPPPAPTLPADGGPVPGEIVEHQAHAIGHAAVLLADRGVLLAGDMLSDVLIPILDHRRPGQVGAYQA